MECIASQVIPVLLLILFLNYFVYAYTNGSRSEADDDYRNIAGGVFTITNEFPFMAALGWKNNKTGEIDFLGGGMLITPNFVLTAAHCVFLKGKLPDVVTIGGNTLDETESNEFHYIRDVFIYPQYNEKQAYYDIALFQLAANSEPPVCLWTRPSLYTTNVTAIGYGTTQYAGSRSVELQKVELIVFPEKICNPYFKRQRKFRMGISHSHICGGDPEGKKDTCQGDSGGPLLVEHAYQTYAAGITSTGQACSGFPPAVYTRISSFIGWIEEIVNEHGYSIRKTCGIR